MQLENKAAIVTGGARGIGLAIARRYVAEGAKVVIADVDAAAGEAAASALDGAPGSFVRTHVGARRDAAQVGAGACPLFGGVAILVNNPGNLHPAPLPHSGEVGFAPGPR